MMIPLIWDLIQGIISVRMEEALGVSGALDPRCMEFVNMALGERFNLEREAQSVFGNRLN